MEEVQRSFYQQKKGYNFTNTILNPVKGVLFGLILVLFNLIFFAVDIVKWAPSMLFTVPKKGNLKLITNWRGIQLSEYFNAWYDRILSNRIKMWMCVDQF